VVVTNAHRSLQPTQSVGNPMFDSKTLRKDPLRAIPEPLSCSAAYSKTDGGDFRGPPQPSGAQRWNLDVRPTSAKLVSHCCTTAPNTCKRRGADFSQPLPTWNGENVEERDPDVPGRTRVQSRHSSLAGRRRAPAGRVAFRRQLDPVDCKPSVAVPLTRRARWRVPHEGAPPTSRGVSLPRTLQINREP
jgi:hypothetical protein